ncbi:glycosyltransferase family 4 protein [Fibrobacter sp. UBA4297]|uniref:glycosyltransferase family 4 protein n=1 Tax=Fibrobacter sp. UBA4297 TaxID=1946536 RepID=UPI0025C6AC7E|nr:glycosyltransferase family 4 protein [Fibrobacter sp. UBA4297]
MKILVVNYRDRMHPAAGGAEKHLHRIFGKIVEMGHTVVLFTTTFPGAKEREVVDGIQVIRKGGDLMFQLTVALNLKKLDREFNFDVVVEDLNKLPVFAHWFVRKPLLVQMHHLWRKSIFAEAIFPIAFMVWFFERIIPFFYRMQNFVVVSPSTKKELAEIGVDESQISVIYNGSEKPKVAECADSCEIMTNPAMNAANPYFIWLSRVHRYKGIWTALEAFEKFSKLHPEVKLYVVGDGPLLKKLPAWIKSHGLDGKVVLTGFVPAARKYELLSSSLALLQTSYKEGWGLTVMEAAQLCKTTIASDVPGLCDSVRDGETGILFPSGDAAACALAMEKIYGDAGLRAALGQNAKRYALTFSWENSARETLELLQRTVEGGVRK